MQQMSSIEEVLEKVAFLFERYSLERRATTQPYLLQIAQQTLKDYQYQPDDSLIRETLMEHVGSLPVLAMALYPYIQDDKVVLGDSLAMLAIHDIGELLTGDEMTFTKAATAAEPEREAALKLLDPLYHNLYHDVEAKASQSAKFAKSIDKITPDIFDYLTPADITIRRYKHFVGVEKNEIIDLIVKHKRPYMAWNPFMTEFHAHLMTRLAAKLK